MILLASGAYHSDRLMRVKKILRPSQVHARRVCWAIAIWLLTVSLHAQTAFQLVEPAGGASANAVAEARADLVRSRRVRVRREGLAGLPGEQRRIELELFVDTRCEFEARLRRNTSLGSRVWVSEPDAYCRFVGVDGPSGFAANIQTGSGESYRIRAAADGLYEISQTNSSLPDRTGDAVAPAAQGLQAAQALNLPMQSAAAVEPQLDVLVVYTPQARTEIGSAAGVIALAELTMAEVNEGFANSEVGASVRLAGVVERAAPASQVANSSFLNTVTDDDDIADLRNQYGADFVTVWIDGPGSNGGVVGIGWIMQNPGPSFQSAAYSVVEINWVDGPSYSFAHELGHNLGCAHDRNNASVSGAYSFSYGYQQGSWNPRFITIMAYQGGCTGCVSINHWSNPAVSYGGNPTGISSPPNAAADNAQTINLTAVVGEAFRASIAPPPAFGDAAGFYENGTWALDADHDGNLEPAFDLLFGLGFPGAIPVVGDWNGDGRDNVGVFAGGFWFLDYNGDGDWDGGLVDRLFPFGWAGAVPVVGDWNGDGRTSVGVYSNGFWFLDYNGDGLWDGGLLFDRIMGLGWPGVSLQVGDWDGDGRDQIGVFAQGFWFLDYNGNYAWDGNSGDRMFGFGWNGVQPIVGDWNGDGRDKVAVYNQGSWFFDYDGDALWTGSDSTFLLGWPGAAPVVGDWNESGTDKPGVAAAGNWFLDFDGSLVWDEAEDLVLNGWGGASSQPFVGRW